MDPLHVLNVEDSIEKQAIPQERVLLHMPVDIRSAALAVIAVLLTIFALHWASAVFIPLLVGLVVSYALTPVVDGLSVVGCHALLALQSLLGLLWPDWGGPRTRCATMPTA